MNVAGIDVSYQDVVMVVSVNGKAQKAKTFKNTPSGHQTILQSLTKLKGEVRVCIEATGIYHFDLAVALSRIEQVQVMIINPRASHNFAQALLKRSKTDAVDAATLAVYCERMPFELWHRPADEVISLRAISRRIASLNKLKTQTKNQLHALNATAETPSVVIEQTQQLIDLLDQQVESLRDNALELIGEHTELNKPLELILTIKGIAEASAIQLLGELLILPKELSAKQWVAYAGLDPRQFESGSSIAKKPRISKAGNKHVRQALYMPALVATRFDVHIKGYYTHLIEDNGLKKMQAICAVMRKLLHAIHGMLKTNEEFDGTRFYTLSVKTN